MFRNYLKIALRNFWKQRGYSVLNLLGLALGIACGLLIILHIKQELSYENGFPKKDRIYRLVTNEWAKSQPPLGLLIQDDLPEIRLVARFFGYGSVVMRHGDFQAEEKNGFFADSSAIKVFDLQFVRGNPVNALSAPSTVLITEKMARKYFKNGDALGKTLKVDNNRALQVTGVIRDLDFNTHLRFDYLVSVATFYQDLPKDLTSNRGWMAGWTYALFDSEADVEKAKKKVPDFLVKYYQSFGMTREETLKNNSLVFQPLTDVHLRSRLEQEIGPNGDVAYVYMFAAVATFILLIACVNFVNIFTAQAFRRMKEVGVRKLLGAQQGQLVWQFLGEAFLMTLLASLLATGLYAGTIPFYNGLTDKAVAANALFDRTNLAILGAIILAVGLLSGLYPAFFVSGFKPIRALKGLKDPRSSAHVLRKTLVVFQFVVSVFMLISTVIVYQQMTYFRSKDLGFDKDQIVAVKLYGSFYEKILANPGVVKAELLKDPRIRNVARSSNLIGDAMSVENVTPFGAPEGKEFPTVRVMRTDEDFLKTMNIALVAGRSFSMQFNDSASYLLNEKAVQVLGLKDGSSDGVGKQIIHESAGGVRGTVVGVIKDFHFASLHNVVEPLVIQYKPEFTGTLLVKIRAGETAPVLKSIESTMKAVAPNNLFVYSFLDERINALYRAEDNVSRIFNVFAAFALVISCLGLFGLSANATEIRTKEVGIRKVLGASVSSIVRLLSKEFVVLVLIGNVIAWPLAWYAANRWLAGFAYRIDVQWWVFVAGGLLAMLIALLTVSYQAIRAALVNPIKSLRTE